MRGSIIRRGKHSWRLKFDLDRENGERRTRYLTVKGTRKEAEAELARHLSEAHRGILIDPSKVTVGAYLHQWLAGRDLSPSSRQQYLDIIVRQVEPVLGQLVLQKLKPVDVKAWLSGLRRRDGSKLHPRTIHCAYRVLHSALAEAVQLEMVSRNVAAAATPPRVRAEEVEILTAGQITALLKALGGSRLHAIATLAFATGMRRGELLALRWRNVDLHKGAIKVEQSLEQTKAGLRFKEPKSRHGVRTILVPASTTDMLSRHRKAQLEIRMVLGMGKPDADALVFCNHHGEPISPNSLTASWIQAITRSGLPRVTFHACRHSHASALIAAGIDVVSVSRRLGHSSPTITLSTYAHLFRETDAAAAAAIEQMLK